MERFVSPGHWATIEVGKSGGDTKKKKDEKDDKDDKDDKERRATRTIRTRTTETQTSMREPMITVRSSGRLKYAAASAVM